MRRGLSQHDKPYLFRSAWHLHVFLPAKWPCVGIVHVFCWRHDYQPQNIAFGETGRNLRVFIVTQAN
jgi:hypothetical protein